MNIEEIREAINGLKDILDNQLCETQYPMKNHKALILAIKTFNAYLSLQGFPGEQRYGMRGVDKKYSVGEEYIEGFNEALHLCRLAHLKAVDKERIEKIVGLKIQDEIIQYRDGLLRCNVEVERAQRNLAVLHDFVATREIVSLLAQAIQEGMIKE